MTAPLGLSEDRPGVFACPLGRAAYTDTVSRAELEQPFVAQESQRAQDGVRVDVHNRFTNEVVVSVPRSAGVAPSGGPG